MKLRVKGADQLGELAKELKAADKDIKRELMREMRAAAKPAGQVVRQAYGDAMPRRGGFADRARRSAIAVQVRTSGKYVGARLKLRNRYSLYGIEQGRLRHPVFGTRDAWAEQTVPKEVGGKAFQEQAPGVQRRMLKALDRVAERITKG